MPHTPTRSRTKRRRPKSPGPRVNLKKLRESLEKNTEIQMASPHSIAHSPQIVMPSPVKGGAHAKRLRSITRRLKRLPKNVEFIGFMNKKQAAAIAGH